MLARPGLPGFKYVRAESFDEVLRLLVEHGEVARSLMGGTDLFPKMRDGVVCPDVLIDVKHLPGMSEINYDEQNGLTIGAAVTMNQIVQSPEVQDHYPLLAEAANSVGSYQLRNRATIGGNLCNASPCADTALATLVLDGSVVLYGKDRSIDSEGASEREVQIASFFTGPGETVLESGEIMKAIRIPLSPAEAVGCHLKLSRNKLGDLSIVSVDVLGYPLERVAGQVGSTDTKYIFRIGLGSVAPTVIRATQAEELMTENPPREEAFLLSAEKAAEEASPMDDVRAGAVYRKAMVHNLTLRGLKEVWGELSNK